MWSMVKHRLRAWARGCRESRSVFCVLRVTTTLGSLPSPARLRRRPLSSLLARPATSCSLRLTLSLPRSRPAFRRINLGVLVVHALLTQTLHRHAVCQRGTSALFSSFKGYAEAIIEPHLYETIDHNRQIVHEVPLSYSSGGRQRRSSENVVKGLMWSRESDFPGTHPSEDGSELDGNARSDTSLKALGRGLLEIPRPAQTGHVSLRRSMTLVSFSPSFSYHVISCMSSAPHQPDSSVQRIRTICSALPSTPISEKSKYITSMMRIPARPFGTLPACLYSPIVL